MALRLEYKYLVPTDILDEFRQEIQPFVNVDPYALDQEKCQYTVRSIYLDSSDLECYKEKVDGIKDRRKYRIRGYGDISNNDIIYLEIKRKYNNYIDKNRAPLYRNTLQDFLQTKDVETYILNLNANGLGKEDARKFLFYYSGKSLKPVNLIVYEREAYTGKFEENLRITLDKNLRSAISPSLDNLNNGRMKLAIRGNFILEVKFQVGLPFWLKSIINRYNLPRMALSKYVLCLDSIQPLYKISPSLFPPHQILYQLNYNNNRR